MASTNHTPNLNLNQWLATDPVMREDFNADNTKIDTAVAEKAKIIVGTYTGNNAATRTIDLGAKPKAVLVMLNNGKTWDGTSRLCGGLALDGVPCRYNSDDRWPVVTVVNNGFTVYCSTPNASYSVTSNNSAFQFHYIAFL